MQGQQHWTGFRRLHLHSRVFPLLRLDAVHCLFSHMPDLPLQLRVQLPDVSRELRVPERPTVPLCLQFRLREGWQHLRPTKVRLELLQVF